MKPPKPGTLRAWAARASRLAVSTLVALATPAVSSGADEAPDRVTDRVDALRQRWQKDGSVAARHESDGANAPQAQTNLWDDWDDWDDWKNWEDSA